MNRTGVLQEIRQMRFEAILDRHEAGELSQIEAAELLGISERSLRRWRERLREEGVEGLKDRRIGKPSGRRAPADEIVRMLGLYREHYGDFTVKHFHDQLKKRHNYALGYTQQPRRVGTARGQPSLGRRGTPHLPETAADGGAASRGPAGRAGLAVRAEVGRLPLPRPPRRQADRAPF
jgi:transposase